MHSVTLSLGICCLDTKNFLDLIGCAVLCVPSVSQDETVFLHRRLVALVFVARTRGVAFGHLNSSGSIDTFGVPPAHSNC